MSADPQCPEPETLEEHRAFIDHLAAELGFCLVCVDAGTPGALLEDCDHGR